MTHTDRASLGLEPLSGEGAVEQIDDTLPPDADERERQMAAALDRERELEREGELERESEEELERERVEERGRERERELDRERRRTREREREREGRERQRQRAERERERALARPPVVRVEAGLSATTREQVLDDGAGGRVRYGLTPFASAFGSIVLTPLSRLESGPRGLGMEVAYDRALRVEASAQGQPLAASVDHFSALCLYDYRLRGGVVIGPRLGYDLSRYGLQQNDVLSGIVYESIALGAQARIPLAREKLRIRFGGMMYFPIGLGEATMRYGASGSASGFQAEAGVEGRVSANFGYFAILRHVSYSASFRGADAGAGETKSQDGITSGLAGAQLLF